MKKIALICCFFLFSCCWLNAKPVYTKVDLTPYNHLLVGTYSFEGDKHGEFEGNSVAVLDDLSFWKVHPTHTDRFSEWKFGEEVHVTVRTSWYFFKREHKFALYNHERNEEVFVMLVQSPFLIYEAQNPNVVQTYNGYPSAFRVNITLNDGGQWEVEPGTTDITRDNKDKYFAVGTPAYVGYIKEDEGISFFVINELEREAHWRWARKGNYSYTW